MADDFAPTILPNVQISIKSEAEFSNCDRPLLLKLRKPFVPFELTLPYEAAYQLPILRKIALIDTVVAEDETGDLLCVR